MADLWTVVGKVVRVFYNVSVDDYPVPDWEDICQVWVSASFRDEEEAKGHLAEIQDRASSYVLRRNALIEDLSDFEIERRNQEFDLAWSALKSLDEQTPPLDHPDDNGADFFYHFEICQNPLKGFRPEGSSIRRKHKQKEKQVGKPTKAYLNQITNTIAMLSLLDQHMPMSEVLHDQDGNLALIDDEGKTSKLTPEQAAASIKAMRSSPAGEVLRKLRRLQTRLQEKIQKPKAQKRNR